MVLQQSPPAQLEKIAPPGPPQLPFVGMRPFLAHYPFLALEELAKKYGNVFQIRVGSRNVLVLSGLETIREALVKRADEFNGKADFFVYNQPPQCYFLEKKSGENWERHHALVGQVIHNFVSGNSGTMESWVLEEATDLTEIFLNSGGKPIDPNIYMPRATLSFIQRLIFNKRGTINDPQEDSDFIQTAYSGIKLNLAGFNLTKLQLMPLAWLPFVLLTCIKPVIDFARIGPVLERYLNDNVNYHKETFDPKNLRDITDGLLAATNELTEHDRNDIGLSEKDIVDGTLMQFIGAGTEPPSIMVRWCLLYAITHPELQAKIHQEMDEVIGRDGQPRLEHRSKLVYTNAFINEVMRHSSPTNQASFVYATNNDTTLEGYFIPKNTPTLINYYGLTRDERFWPEPEKFDPNRFLSEKGKLRTELTDKSYLFGVGSRKCIGEYFGRMLIFLIFTNLMHKCKFEPVPGEEYTLKSKQALQLCPQDYKIIAKPRF